MTVSVLSDPQFHDEAAAFAFVEARLWPHGPVCHHCKSGARVGALKGKTTRPGLYKCYACRKPFTVRMGTVFEASHIEMHKWLQAIYLMCSSKKGISTNQLSRTLRITIKSAWFLSHRIREAMTTMGMEPMGGLGGIVEVDETFIGRKQGTEVARGFAHKNAVLSLVERRPAGSVVRSFHVDGTSARDLMPILMKHVDPNSHVMTDEAGQYTHLARWFMAHDFTTHSKGEYVSAAAPYVHTNTVENFYSVFKRGMKGVYQHCAEHHLHRYVTEFDFRYNNRVRFGINDTQRADTALLGVVGKRLTYRTTVGAGQA
jgi:transposase-like protein